MIDGLDGSTWPSADRVLLPSRALLLSWQQQTLPTRSAAIDDALQYWKGLEGSDASGARDFALLGVIAEAMQPIEDLAYLATAWDEPLASLATYVGSTVWSGWTASGFWQRIHKRDRDYFDVLAGFASRDPHSGAAVDILTGLGDTRQFGEDVIQALADAREATRERLRQTLRVLARDWGQFSDYFYAYKHGGIAVHRADVMWVDDAVEEVTDETPRHSPSIAVWSRSGKRIEGRGDFNLSPEVVARSVAASGRDAIRLVAAFVRTRLAIFDAVEFDAGGSIVALLPMQIPWTTWLDPGDLPEATWKLIGHGPRIEWVSDTRPETGEIPRGTRA